MECYQNGGPKLSACAPTVIVPSCNCRGNTSRRMLNCIYLTGIEEVDVTFCDCTPDPITLLENHLFPASPTQPRVAFHLSFLDLYSELRAEGHLSCQAFASGFSTLNKFEHPDTIRRALANAFFEYLRVKEDVNRVLSKYEQQDCSSEIIECPDVPRKKIRMNEKHFLLMATSSLDVVSAMIKKMT
ncbi:hypothetical protein BJV82DRAFT_280590 [Fennellomyces sp. T-0311]|nr:hypothetical protein BJV82DRAFT_280590 [Fennellomyces sp. T-0311]